jgi:NLI interacting factor-like phosphatase
MWCPVNRFSYFVKIRPFLREFMGAALANYKIYFYTAANSAYAKLILDILKLEMGTDTNKNVLENTFQPKRLISRDDKHKFNTSETKNE